MIDLPPVAHFELPAKPAIIRPAEHRLLSTGFLPVSRSERRAALSDLLSTKRLSSNDVKNALIVKLPPEMAMLMVNQLNGFGGRRAAGAGGGSDPYLANVVLLLGFNGTNGATTTTDDSLSAHATPTFAGNAKLDTSQFKFGTSSLVLDGSGDYIQYPDSPDWTLGTGQFTIEGWYRWNVVSGNPCLIGQMGGSDTWMIFLNAGTDLLFRDGNAHFSGTYSFTPTANTWYHIACDRDASNVIRLYINGVMGGKAAYAFNIGNTADPLTIGTRYGGASSYDFNGWVDEIRITANIARYASDAGFAVPTAAFPRV